MILVTGASGFVGRHLVAELVRRGMGVRAAARVPTHGLRASVETAIIGDLSRPVEWRRALDGVDAVVHLAARAHALRDRGARVESLYRAVNADATRALAEAAAGAGVRRLVFLSSSKVLGEQTRPGLAWREDAPPAPVDAYGRSKLAAEQALGEVSRATGIELVILRPPVVYGPGVRANIFELFRLVDRGVPLPLGLVRNRRSFIFVGNLVDAIILVLREPPGAREVFHLCDGAPISTATLATAIGRALDRQVRLVPVPPRVLRLAGWTGDLVERVTRVALPVNSDNVTRMVASLVLDDAKLRTQLGWQPPIKMDAGLAATAAWYQSIRTRAIGDVPDHSVSVT